MGESMAPDVLAYLHCRSSSCALRRRTSAPPRRKKRPVTKVTIQTNFKTFSYRTLLGKSLELTADRHFVTVKSEDRMRSARRSQQRVGGIPSGDDRSGANGKAICCLTYESRNGVPSDGAPAPSRWPLSVRYRCTKPCSLHTAQQMQFRPTIPQCIRTPSSLAPG